MSYKKLKTHIDRLVDIEFLAAIRLACEAVQVAAMAEKYTKSQIARHEADKNGKR